MIPVSIVVTTYNEERNIERCLNALQSFDEVLVVDSSSIDGTILLAQKYPNVTIHNFVWNGQYPKKRQFILDHIKTKHNYIFFVDADEEVTPALVDEIRQLNFQVAGYFVKGIYSWNGKLLRYGLHNNKLALFDRNKICFPVVDDLDIDGMGEIEGHYQPILKGDFEQISAPRSGGVSALQNSLIHFAYEDQAAWQKRHERYAHWEAQMIKRNSYPKDPAPWREQMKKMFRAMPARSLIAFIHSYIIKRGFLDGRAGYEFAKSRARYYILVESSLSCQ